ncbi:uncharacterized protein LOC134177637 [Corticium candelabrum]|uniref:uncharacterized protein LOC134177637 n=1 Tax=Corticium candelabrum TaxID=121492 RepID=UPI002E252AF9|nr:uncharacterized protein LOC134177637 [Corticium candelabrum]
MESDCHVKRSRLPCRLERLLPAGCCLPLPLADGLILVLARRHKLSDHLLDIFFNEDCEVRSRILPLYARHVPYSSLGNMRRFSQLTTLDLSFSKFYSSCRQYAYNEQATAGMLSELAGVCANGLRVLKLSNVSGNVGLDALPRFNHLQHLDVSYTRITPQIVQEACLFNVGELTHLDVSGTVGLSLVHLMPSLQHLEQLSYLGVQKALLALYEKTADTSSLSDVVSMLVDSFGKMKSLTSIDMGSVLYGTYTHTGSVTLEEMTPKDFLAAVLPSLHNLTSLDLSYTDHLSLSDIVAELTSCGLLNKLLFLGFAVHIDESRHHWDLARTLSQSDHLKLGFIEHYSYNVIDATPLLREKYIYQQGPVLALILSRLIGRDMQRGEPAVHALEFVLQCLCLLGLQKDGIWQVVCCGVLNRLPQFDPQGTVPTLWLIQVWEQILEEVCYLAVNYSEKFLRSTFCKYCTELSDFLVERPLLFSRFCCFLVQLMNGDNEDENDNLQNKACLGLSSIAEVTTNDQTLWLVNHAHLLDICVTISQKLYGQIYEENDDDSSEQLYNVVNLIWKLCDGLPAVCEQLISPDGLNFLPFCLQLAWKLQESEFGNSSIPVLGLLSTVAEVPSLRSQVCQRSVLQLFEYLPGKESDGDVVHLLTAYLACLACMDIATGTAAINFPTKDTLLQQINSTMQSDEVLHDRYGIKSFSALLEMTQCINTPAVVSFSLWRIAMLLQGDCDYYFPLLKRDGGIAILQSLVLPAHCEVQCQQHIDSVLQICSHC